jgi:peptidoglycan hydrolase CwlO-like protein
MQNNKPKGTGDDDIFEGEDFDLENFDDEDDIASESWDEFDDAGDTAAPALSKKEQKKAAKAAKKTAAPIDPANKTFLQKNFNLIAIAAVGLLAVTFVAGQMLMGGAPAPSDQTAEGLQADPNAPAELADGDLPPMPAPINTMPGEAPAADITAGTPVELEGALTPMPDVSTESTAELPELNIEEVPATPPGETPEVPVAEFELTAPEQTALAPQEDIQPEPLTPAEQSPDIFDTAAPSPEAPAVQEEPVVEETPAPEAVVAAAPVDTTAVDAVSSRVSALEGELQNINSSLSDKISSTDAKIDSLQQSIASLERSISELANRPAPAAAPAPAESSQSEPASAVQEPPLQAPVEKPAVKPSAPKASSQTSTQWQLRSAQPGKASVSAKDSDDLKTVEVGDNLTGIGKITFIGQENGKWVIKGTKGRITQ